MINIIRDLLWGADAILRSFHWKREAEELDYLFQMQHKREMEVYLRWREEGKLAPLTLPDYGRAIEMLLEELEAVKRGNIELQLERQKLWMELHPAERSDDPD